ncbi:RDD family protein [Luteococcus sp. H101]
MDWYPDPADPARERYWDGERWTHNTRPVNNRPAPQAPPTQDPWAAAQPMPGQAGPGQSVGNPQGQWTQPGQGGQWAGQQQGYGYGPYQGGVPAPGSGVGPYTPLVGGKAQQTADGVPLAGWWPRAFAWLLDSVLLTLVTLGLGWKFAQQLFTNWSTMWRELFAQAQAGQEPPSQAELMTKYHLTDGIYSLQAISMAVMLAYLVLMWRFLGATLGQLLLGIRVVPVDRGRAPKQLGWGAALGRGIAFTLLGLIWFIALVNYLMPLGTEKRQALHDMVARTQVVRGR